MHWPTGAVQASGAGVAIALGGILRDVVSTAAPHTSLGAAVGYDFVYALELVLLIATVFTMAPLLRRVRVFAGAGQLS